MSIKNRNKLKNDFSLGKIINEKNFIDLIDTYNEVREVESVSRRLPFYGNTFLNQTNGVIKSYDFNPSIPSNAFIFSGNTTNKLIIGENVENIGSYAFYNLTNIKGDLVIPNSVTDIGNYAFYNTNFDGELVIGDNVTYIGDQSFFGVGFSSLKMGNSVEYIGYVAFNGCSDITNDLVIPDSVTFIGDAAFFGCIGITNVNCYVSKAIIVRDEAPGCFASSGIVSIHVRKSDVTWDAGLSPVPIGGKVGITVIKDL